MTPSSLTWFLVHRPSAFPLYRQTLPRKGIAFGVNGTYDFHVLAMVCVEGLFNQIACCGYVPQIK